jgi:hypothetical protein
MVQTVLSVNDFDRILDNYTGRQITYTPIVKTVSNISGQETLTDGTPKNIKAHFIRTNQQWDFEKLGFLEKGHAVALTKYADGVVQDGKITEGGNTYRVKEAYNVPGVFDSTGEGTAFVYTACNLFLIS